MHHVMPTRYKPTLQPEAFLPVIVKLQKGANANFN